MIYGILIGIVIGVLIARRARLRADLERRWRQENEAFIQRLRDPGIGRDPERQPPA